MYVYNYIYIYMYISLLRGGERGGSGPQAGGGVAAGCLLRITNTPSSPTKSLDFRGFDSSRLLILRGGNSHVR